MKKQRSSLTENVADTLSVIAGQFLVIALKGDSEALSSFRNGFVRHFEKHFVTKGKLEIVSGFVDAGRRFTAIMGSRYGWDENAAAMLAAHVANACRDWVSAENAASSIAKLRTVDLWSGIVSSTSMRATMPLSLLDYVMMTLMPVVCSEGIREVATGVVNLMSGDDGIPKLDEALGKCVKRLCCGVALPKRVENELKLVALLHMPKDTGILSANAGLAYKILQRQYANMEVK